MSITDIRDAIQETQNDVNKKFKVSSTDSGKSEQTKSVTIITNKVTEVNPDSGKTLSKVTATVDVPQPSGMRSIISNGTYDVTDDMYAMVSIPNPSSGDITVTANGSYDVSTKANAYVNVPQPTQSSIYLSENGTYNVYDYQYANVSVPQPAGVLDISENGSYDVSNYDAVEVDVPEPSGSIDITENGQIDVTDYETANVAVSSGGGARLTISSNEPTDHEASWIQLMDYPVKSTKYQNLTSNDIVYMLDPVSASGVIQYPNLSCSVGDWIYSFVYITEWEHSEHYAILKQPAYYYEGAAFEFYPIDGSSYITSDHLLYNSLLFAYDEDLYLYTAESLGMEGLQMKFNLTSHAYQFTSITSAQSLSYFIGFRGEVAQCGQYAYTLAANTLAYGFPVNTVAKMNIQTGSIELLTSKLPVSIVDCAACAYSKYVYLFGGSILNSDVSDPSQASNLVYKIDTTDDSISIVHSTIPEGLKLRQFGNNTNCSNPVLVGDMIIFTYLEDTSANADVLIFSTQTQRFYRGGSVFSEGIQNHHWIVNKDFRLCYPDIYAGWVSLFGPHLDMNGDYTPIDNIYLQVSKSEQPTAKLETESNYQLFERVLQAQQRETDVDPAYPKWFTEYPIPGSWKLLEEYKTWVVSTASEKLATADGTDYHKADSYPAFSVIYYADQFLTPETPCKSVWLISKKESGCKFQETASQSGKFLHDGVIWYYSGITNITEIPYFNYNKIYPMFAETPSDIESALSGCISYLSDCGSENVEPMDFWSATFDDGKSLSFWHGLEYGGEEYGYNEDRLASNSIGIEAFKGCSRIVSVTCPATVGQNAFTNCANLKSVTFLPNVSYIDFGAFQNCTSLVSVDFSQTSNDFYISGSAFYNCASLESVAFPASISNFAKSSFCDCTNLKTITLSPNTDLNEGVFKGCMSLSDIYFNGTKAQWQAVGKYDAFYETGEFVVHCFDGDVPKQGYATFSDGVTVDWNYITDSEYSERYGYNASGITYNAIAANTFSLCDQLVKISLPDEIVTIGESAFDGCSSLEYAYFSDNVTSLGRLNTFYDSGLRSFILPKSCTSIPAQTFGYTQLTTLYIENTLTTIDSGAFVGCSHRIDIYYNGTKAQWNAITKSQDWDYGTGPIVIHCTDGTIYNSGMAKFSDGVELTWDALKLDENGTKYQYNNSVITDDSIGYEAFEGNRYLVSIIPPKTVTSIGNYAFEGCQVIETIDIPDTVTSIGNSSFYDTSATSINIGNGLTEIATRAFWDNNYVTNLTIGNSVTTIGEGSFSGCRVLPTVIIPNSVTIIGRSAFSYCISLETITIGSNVTGIDEYAFAECTSLTKVNLLDLGMWCQIVFAEYEANPLTYAHNLYINDVLATNITIPDGTPIIKFRSFYLCTSLTNVIMPDSIEEIEPDAFYGCTSIASITIGSGTTTIYGGAFSNCSALTSISYRGTMSQWNSIDKQDLWDFNTGNYIIHCTDGDIPKN